MADGWTDLLSGEFAKLTSSAEAAPALAKEQLREGTVREVAVFFLDVKGFTALSEKMSAEEVKFIIDNTFKVFTGEIKKYNGYVDKYIGDAIMALFGTKSSTENASELAVRAGLSIVEKLKQINILLAPKNIELAVRIGVNFGEVVIGRVGEGREKDETAMGDAVNTAQRLESNAPRNSILVTEGTQKYIGDKFVYEEIDPILVKGKDKPLRVVAIRGINYDREYGWQGRHQAAKAPLIGRDPEVAAMTKAYRAAAEFTRKEGDDDERVRNVIIDIVGDAGSGKSRLAFEWVKSLGALDVPPTVLRTSCPPFHASPYAPFMNIVRSFLGIGEGGVSFDKLKEKLAALGIAGDAAAGAKSLDAVSVLALLLDIKVADAKQAQVQPNALALAARLAIRSFLAALAAENPDAPLVLVVEDLQWVEEDTLAALTFVCHQIRLPKPAVIVVTRRRGSAVPETWEEGADLTRIDLPPLSEADVHALIGGILGKGDLPAFVEQQVAALVQGNPLYLEETVAYLIDAGIIVETGDADAPWTTSASMSTFKMPSSVNSIVLSRVDDLEPLLRADLQKASVIGKTFSQDVFDHVSERVEETFDADRSERGLRFLVSEGYLEELASDAARGKTIKNYAFAQQVVQEAVYQTLLEYNRKILHRLTAEAIEALYPDAIEARCLELAYHYERAGVPDKTLACAEESAALLERYGRFSDALEKYEIAESVLDDLPWEGETVEIDGVACPRAKAVESVTIALKKSRQIQMLGRFKEALALAESCVARSDVLCDAVLSARSRMARGEVKWRLGDYAGAEEDIALALPEFEARGMKAEVSRALNNLAIASDYRGVYSDALQYYVRALAITRELGQRAEEGAILGNMAGVYHVRGEYDPAMVHYRDSLAIAQEVGERMGECVTLGNLGAALNETGHYREALDAHMKCLALAREIGNRRGEGRTLNNIGLVLFNQGKLDECLAYYAKDLRIAREVGDRRGEAISLLNAAAVHAVQANLGTALEYATEAQRVFADIGYKAAEGGVLNALGYIELLRKNYGRAAHFFSDAAAKVDEVGDAGESAVLLHNQADLAEKQGKLYDALLLFKSSVDAACCVRNTAEVAASTARLGALMLRLAEDATDDERATAAADLSDEALTPAIAEPETPAEFDYEYACKTTSKGVSDVERGASLLAGGVELANELGHAVAIMRTRLALGMALKRLGATDRAKRLLESLAEEAKARKIEAFVQQIDDVLWEEIEGTTDANTS